MKSEKQDDMGKKLDRVVELLEQLVVLELSRRGAPQDAIGRNVHMQKARVVRMLSGIKKDASDAR